MLIQRFLEKKAPGSYTVEAALVCSITLLVIGGLIHQALLVHDRTAADMILQEAVEEGRRQEEEKSLEEAVNKGMKETWILREMSDYEIRLKQDGKRTQGTGAADGFENNISMPEFDPEAFLRLVEGIAGVGGEKNGNLLQAGNEP